MAINFPASPALNAVYTFGGRSWQFNGSAWVNITTTLGPTGLQGLTSTQGTQGTQGLQGAQGTTGTQGLTGLQGFTGLQGTNGLTGIQGTQGATGIQGLTGTQGLIGIQGTTGLQGLTGPQGLTGLQGTTGTQGLTGTQGALGSQGTSATVINTIFTSPSELTNIVSAAPTATNNIDINTSQDWLFTINTANNFAPNIRGDVSTSLNTVMAVGNTKVVNIRVSNGATAYYITAITIDGNAQTVKWQGGAAPTAGNISSDDWYAFAITKTAAATFKVGGTQTKFA